jgi:N4-gp56 family major capsid protein
MSKLQKPIQALYNAAARQALTEEGTFWRAARIIEVLKSINADENRSQKAAFDVWKAGKYEQKEIELREHGQIEPTPAKLRLTDYGAPEERAAWQMGINAADGLDLLARVQLDRGAAQTEGRITVDHVKSVYADMLGRKIQFHEGGYFICYIHPHVFHDLSQEINEYRFVSREVYAHNLYGPVMRGEVGAYEGFRFVLTNNTQVIDLDNMPVYTTYFVGNDAIGFAHCGDLVQVIFNEPDLRIKSDFGRFTALGWYSLCGFTPLREDALIKYQCTSSITKRFNMFLGRGMNDERESQP